MRIKNITISFFLLFVYSFGFAHSIMPHQHSFYAEHQPELVSESKDHHNHEHHVCEVPNESCIDHNDHCDDGLLDLIACFLSDFDSQHQDCDIEINVNSNDKRLDNRSSNFTSKFGHSNFIIFIGPSIFSIDEKINFNVQFLIDYSSPPIQDSPHRGPPFLV